MSALRDEDVEAVLDALRSGWLTMGPRIQAFEAAFAERVGAPHAVACSSGTSALHLALLAERLPPGAPVLVPAVGGRAAAEAVRHAGGEPVVRSERPAAIVAVHAHGFRADVEALVDTGVPVIEDARGALGVPGAGTIGRSGCFSFADGRLLPMGEGGMVVTADEDVAARVRLLRAHAMTSGTWDRHRGHSDTYDVVDVGFNFRLDEPRAALGLSRLARLDEDLAARRALAVEVAAALAAVDGAEPWTPGPDDAPDALPVAVADRDAALAALRAAGVPAWAEPGAPLLVVGLDPAPDPERVAAALSAA